MQAASAHEFGDGSMSAIMSEYDTNGDGFVDAEELAAEWDWTVENAQGHIDSFDEDMDGLINSTEFADVMNRIENHLHGA